MQEHTSFLLRIQPKAKEHLSQQVLDLAARKTDGTLTLLDELVQKEVKGGDEAMEEGDRTTSKAELMAAAGMIGGAVVALALGAFLTLSITHPVKRVIDGLMDTSSQVAAASGQVSGASQQLDEGTSQQAAGIEETSSSMEEMSSMTRQNAHNVLQADQLFKNVSAIVSQANESMGQLSESMGQISRASEETHKIIKTIDEIAFQTNLLALNVAVEAARAGERILVDVWHSLSLIPTDQIWLGPLLADRKQIWRKLLATLIQPMVTAEWWQQELNVLERLVNDVHCYTMHFDRTGAIVPKVEKLTSDLLTGGAGTGIN
jgi:hypothetical protein